jgi:hypothetical protein
MDDMEFKSTNKRKVFWNLVDLENVSGSLDLGWLSNASKSLLQLLDKSVLDLPNFSSEAKLRPDRHFNSQELKALCKHLSFSKKKIKKIPHFAV